ncbi:glutathione S-transferase family protein [Sphingosinicella xenopeptidilytica]|uniref:Glutathione S-transferase family protein n=1 Tax=Sphingosinicella xenopeptidilytica TaxID=364098 RepID=A0ABW3BZ00_SPHXN
MIQIEAHMHELYGIPMATCARKALHVMFEKGADIAYREVEREYLRTTGFRLLNPEGLVPVLVTNDGHAISESSIVMRYIDDTFPGPPLQPSRPLARANMNMWLKLVDERYFGAIGAITVATFIRAILGDPLDEAKLRAMLDAIEDDTARSARELPIRLGVDAPTVRIAIRQLPAMLRRMEQALEHTRWLADDELSLADSAVMPLMLRLEEFGLEALWMDGGLPNVDRWWQALRAREASKRLLDLVHADMRAQITASADALRTSLLSQMHQHLG